MDSKLFDSYRQEFNQWQQQFVDWQKKFLDNYLESLPKNPEDVDLQAVFNDGVALQEELVQSYLENQAKANELLLASQKQFWADYFDLMRKAPAMAPN